LEIRRKEMPSYYVEWIVGDEDDGYVVQAETEAKARVLVGDALPEGAVITTVSQVGDCCG
jgi:hypothetical protein